MASSEDSTRRGAAAAEAARTAADLVAIGHWADARQRVHDARQASAGLPDAARARIELDASASAVLIEWHTYGDATEFTALRAVLREPRERNELRAEHAPALYAIGSVQTRRGEFCDAVATLGLARALVAADSPLALPVRAELALAQLRAGDWAHAWATIEAAESDIAPATEDARSIALLAALRALRPAFEFDVDGVAAAAASARVALARGWSPLADAIGQHAQVCAILGSLVWDDLLRATRDVESRGYRPLHLPAERRTLEVLALANQPDVPAVRGIVDAWTQTPDAATSPYYWVARGLVAEYDDDDPAVLAAVDAASRTLTGREDPLGYAHVLMTAGNMLARRGSPAEAMTWWERARDGLARIGAAAFVEVCTRMIEQHSTALIEKSDNPLKALTNQQRSVVRLVASGRTSVEIARELSLSRKTVDFHVANALTRLHLSSRRELRDVWDRWSFPR